MKRTGTALPVSTADQSARQLDQGIRQLIAVVNENTTIARASLPQFFGLGDLVKRWNRSPDSVIKVLQHHLGYRGERGHRLSISLSDVLKVDRALEAEYEARKSHQPATALSA